MAPETAIIAQQSTHEISPNIPHSNEVTTIQVGLAIIPVAFVLTLAFVFIKQVKYQKNLHTQLVNLKHFLIFHVVIVSFLTTIITLLVPYNLS
ncbi:MAG: hypothetical protein AAGG00_09685 [Cyanobacteria bacterium P01_H01_bin.150]